MRYCLLLVLLFSVTAEAQRRPRLSSFYREAKPLYRKPTSKELQSIRPDADLRLRYQSFLNQSDTGLTKLVADNGCTDSEKIVSAEAKCLKYPFPGGGSSFSFRTKNYRIARLADITLTRNSFQATGAILHGIFVDLGNVPVNSVTEQTNGVGFLVRFAPEKYYSAARRTDQILSRGVIRDGFAYRRALFAKDDVTYALRSIAYRGRLFRSLAGFTYNELAFDKRRDVLIVFRIVRRHDDGAVTILWKELNNRKAPKLRFFRRRR